MIIRYADPTELKTICELHRVAFGVAEGDDIAALVAQLDQDSTATPSTSLVAEQDGIVVGHVLFTAIQIPPNNVNAQILAPLAVAPTHHRQGIGSQLVREGLAHIKAQGNDVVFVLGNPAYYRRFGFASATPLGLYAPYPIPAQHADAWMVQAFEDGMIGRIQGTVQCANALNNPQYW